MAQKFLTEITLQALNNATTDTDKFLVSDGGTIKFRTGAEVLSDIGGQVAGNYVPTSRTLTINGVTYDLSTDRSWTVNETDTLATVVDRGNTTNGGRPISMDTSGGGISIKGSGGGWATGYYFTGNAGTYRGGFGALGGNDTLSYYWIGPAYNAYYAYVDVDQLYHGSSVRAPIFYDSGNTGYYLDPASTSNIYRLTMNERITLGVFPASTVNTGEAWIGKASDRLTGTMTVQLGGNSPSSRFFEVVDYAWSDVLFSTSSTGISTASASFRAPIFYDSNNTSYYLDPAGNTAIRTVGSWRADSSPWDGEFAGKIQYHDDSWYFQGGNRFIFRTPGGSEPFTVGQSGSAVATGDMRAPIFYDSNNSGYYMDPASTSNVSAIVANNTIRSSKAQADNNYTTAAIWTESYNTTTTGVAFHISGTVGKFLEMRTNGILYWDNAPVVTTSTISVTFDSLISKTGGTGTYQTSGDFRAPIFYDSGNTGYYLDLNGTSNIYRAVFDRLTIQQNVPQIDFVDNDQGETRYIHCNGGSLGFLSNIGSWILRTTNSEVEVYGAMYADIYYDRNNTAYYLNPNGVSSLSQVYSDNLSVFSGKITLGTNTSGSYNGNTTGLTINSTAEIRSSGAQNTPALTFHWEGVATRHISLGSNGFINILSPSNENGGVSILTANQLRANIFYDSDNTSYYLDPASTSVFNGLTVAGYELVRSRTQGNWAGSGVIDNVVGLLTWKNYGSGHVIFDASNGTTPSGTSCSSSDPQNNWTGTYPTLMGWNGANTYGVRVDSARVADSVGSVAWTSVTGKPSNIFYYQGFTLNANTMDSNSSGFTYQNNAPFNGPVARFSANGGYDLWLNADYGGGAGFAFRTKNGDTGTFNAWRYPALYGVSVNGGGALYATMYYDQDDTTYYLDPNNTTTSLNIAGKVQINYGGASASTLIQATGSYGTMSLNTYYGVMHTSGELYIGNPAGGATNLYGAQANFNLYSDRNNSAYYVDPASTSVLSAIDTGNVGAYNRFRTWTELTAAHGFYSSINGAHIYPNNSSYGSWKIEGNRNGWGGIEVQYGSNGNVSFMTNSASTSSGIHNNVYGWQIRFDQGALYAGRGSYGGSDSRVLQEDTWINSKYFSSGGEVYAPVFYDADDSTYFFDGSSTGDSIRCAGDIVAYYSDERLKDRKGNIENALEKVLSLNGFYYEPNEKAQALGYKKKLEVGVSAQEVQAILPEIIKDAPIGGDYKTLDYGRLTPLLIEAIKEQQTQIDELKELVNKLINK